MDIDSRAVSFGKLEHQIQVALRIRVECTRINSADEIHSVSEALFDEFRNAGLQQQTSLREGDDLDIRTVLVQLAGSEHTRKSVEPAIRIDLGIAPGTRHPVLDRAPQR